MKENKLCKHLVCGAQFFSGRPQFWHTILFGVCIISTFLFFAWKFATFAQDAQRELIHVRTSSILDTFAILAPDNLGDAERMRIHMKEIRSSNPTMLSFVLYAIHGGNSWRVYVSEQGPREGAVIEAVPMHFGLAWADSSRAYTSEFMRGDDRLLVTARAILDKSGAPVVLAVTEQTMSEADKQIFKNIQNSMNVFTVVLVAISILFFRRYAK